MGILRYNGRNFFCSVQHWLQHILFVRLCPGSHWQLSNFYSFGVNNLHISTDKVFLGIDLSDGANKVLVRWSLKRMSSVRCKLQSSQVKRTPQNSINQFIIRKLSPLTVVDFRFICTFLHA